MSYDLVNFVLAVTRLVTAIFFIAVGAIKVISSKSRLSTRPGM